MAAYEMVDLYCYRRHGYMPEQVVPNEHVRGEWAICPRCALGADPDPRCLREIHMARIMEHKVATQVSTNRAFINENLAALAKKAAREGDRRRAEGCSYRVPIIGSATKTVADDKKRDELRRAQDAAAKAQGHADRDAKLDFDPKTHGEIWKRYQQRIRSENA